MARHRWLRRTLGLGLVAGAAYAVWRAIEANRVSGEAEWEAQPFPFPPQPRTDAPVRPSSATLEHQSGQEPEKRGDARGKGSPIWQPPVDGACPSTHPVKAKESSRIFHVPGGLSYERTVPDRCYLDAAAAESDGYRAAKR